MGISHDSKVVIYNPVSGRGFGARIVAKAKELLGPRFDWIATRRIGHAIEISRELSRSAGTIVACGGDGTVGDVVRGIVSEGQELGKASLGILPVGTGNDVARNLQIPLNVEGACHILQRDNRRRIDIGMVNGTPFVNNVGAGFDAAVMERMNRSVRFLRGQPAFLWMILRTLPFYKPFPVRFAIDDQPMREEKIFMISVTNGQHIGGGLMATPSALMDDGKMDVIIIKAMSKLRLLPLVFKVRYGGHIDHPAVELHQFRKLHIETDSVQKLNLDGEVRGETPIDIAVRSRMIEVIAPPV